MGGAPFTWFSIADLGVCRLEPHPQQQASFLAVWVLNFLMILVAKPQTGPGRTLAGQPRLAENSAGPRPAAGGMLDAV